MSIKDTIANFFKNESKEKTLPARAPRPDTDEPTPPTDKETAQRVEFLQALNEAAAQLQQFARSKEEVFQTVSEQIAALGLRGGLSTLDQTGQHLIVQAVAYPQAAKAILNKLEALTNLETKGFSFPLKDAQVYCDVVQNRRAAFVTDSTQVIKQMLPKSLRRFSKRIAETFGTSPAIYAPIISQDQVKGVLNVVGEGILPEDTPIIEALSNHVAIALENADLVSALHENEARYRILFEQANDAITLIDEEGHIIEANLRACELFGYSSEQMLTKNLNDLRPAEQIEQHIPIDQHTETTALHSQGTTFPVELTLSPAQQRERQFFLAVWRDLTARKKAQEQLHQSQRMLAILISNLPGIAYRCHNDRYWTMEFISEACLDLTGYPASDLIDNAKLSYNQLIHPDDRQQVAEEVNLAIQENRPFELTYRIVTAAGQTKWVWEQGRVVDITGKGEQILEGFISDITDRIQAEQALQRRAQELSSLNETILDITAPHELPALLQTIVERATNLLGGTGGGLYLCDPQKEEVRCVVSFNTSKDYTGTLLKYGEGAAGIVAQTGQPLIIDDYRTWASRASAFQDDQSFKAVISAPLLWQNQAIGVIHVLHQVEAGYFNQQDLALLIQFASHAAVAVQNTRLLEQARQEINQRQQTEKSLLEEKDKAQTYLDIAEVMLLALDSQGQVTLINQKGCRILGYEETEVMGKNWFDQFLPPEIAEQVKSVFAQLIDGKVDPVEYFENPVLTKSGEQRLIAWHNTILTDQGGLITGTLSSGEDITERREAEQKLRRSEERFRRLTEQSWDIIVLTDEQGNAKFASGSLTRTLGYSVEEYLGTPSLEYVHPEDLPRAEETLRTLLHSPGKPFNLEYRARHRDGSWRWLEVVSVNFLDDPHIQAIVSTHRDIHERQQAQEQLHYQANLLQNVTDAIIATDPDFYITSWNTAAQRIYGWEAEEVIGKLVAEVIPTEYPNHQEAAVLAEFQQQGFWLGEVIQHSKDGTPINILASVSRLEDGQGKAIGAVAVNRDITKRKLAEKAQRESEHLASAIISNVGEGIVVYDHKFRYRLWNHFMEELTGLSAEQVLGKPALDLFPHLKEQGVDQLLEQALTGETVTSPDTPYYIPGTDRKGWIVGVYSPQLSAGGEIIGVVASIRDITARKQAEGALQRQLEELKLLHAVATAGTEATNEDELIERATQIIGESLYSDHFGVMLLDESDNALHVHPSYRGIATDESKKTIQLGEGVTGKVAATGQPRRIEDTSQISEYISPSRKQFRSELCVPLKVGARVLGVINVESARITAFGPADQRLLTTLAGQLATAIEKVRLHQETRQRTKELEAFASVSLALRAATTKKEMLPVILEQIQDLMNVAAAAILLKQPNGGEHKVELASGVWEEISGHTLPEGTGLTTHVTATGSAYINNDIRNDPDPRLSHPELMQKVAAIASIPLIAQEEIIGALWIGQYTSIDADQLRVLSAISNLAANAIQRSSLHDQTEQLFSETTQYAAELRQRNLELARLYRALGSLISVDGPTLQKLGDQIANTVVKVFGQSNCSLMLVQPGSNQVQRLAAAGPYADEVVQGQLFIDGPGLIPKAVRSAQIINVPDVLTHPDYVNNWEAARAELVVPLMAGSKVIGVIDLQSTQLDGFSEEDERLMSIFSERAALAIENARLFEEAHRRLDHLQAQHDIGLAINASLDLHLTLDLLLSQTISQLEVAAADVLLLDESHTLRYAAGRGFLSKEVHSAFVRLGESYAGRAALEQRIVKRSDLSESQVPPKFSQLLADEGFQAYFAVPLTAKGNVLGVLEIYRHDPFDPDPEWLEFLESLANQAAIAIHNAELYDNLQSTKTELEVAYGSTLEGWVHALDLRDDETQGHTQRVTELTLKLAKTLGLPDDKLVHINRGALLHDIGKMAIPDKILRKPGPLSDKEWETMRKHPIYAYELLSPIAYLKPAITIPYCHHEKWDGSGYPRRLKGEEIPIEARVFAVVDVWDALCSDRPYRKAWTKEKARQYLEDQAGKHFDPQIVRVFLDNILPHSGIFDE